MKTKVFIFIGILAMGYFLSGCGDEIRDYNLEKYIYVNKNMLNIFYGDKVQLKANPVGETFEWSSADPAIATVTSDGLVEGVGVGSTEITVNQPGTSATKVSVTVTIPTVDNVFIAGKDGWFQVVVQEFSEQITAVRIIWPNNRDSTDIALNNQSGIFTQTIDYSGENGYVFSIVSIDKFGNRSVSSETTATLLRNRDITQALISLDDKFTIQWGSNIQYVAYSLLSYTDQNGQTIERQVSPDETTTEISNYSHGLTYSTVFMLIPSATEADLFRIGWENPNIVKQVPTSDWTVESRNGNHPWGEYGGGEPFRILDGNRKSAWHSTVGSPLPQCLVVDMKESRRVSRISIWSTSYPYYKDIEVYLTDEPVVPDERQPSWGATAATYVYPGSVNPLIIPLAPDIQGRYLILYFPTSSSSTHINFADLDVYVKAE
jgi:hypothetical protein